MNKASLYSLLADKSVLEDLRIETGGLEATMPTLDKEKLELLIGGNESAVSPGAFSDLEAIILTTGRPSLLVQDGKWETVRAAEIKRRLEAARATLEASIARVGRVEIVGGSAEYVGTGWMIDEDVMVTNRHVARDFAARRGSSFAFKNDADGRTLRVRTDFLREYARDATCEARVLEVLFIEDQSEARPDMALLRLERGNTGLPKPIELDDGIIGFRDNVAAIGYPAEDPRNDAFVMREIFRNVFGWKRVSPGQVSGVRQDGMVLMHDCTTLGGSSGSVIINLATGKACGLHFSGTYRESNYAVTSAAIKQRLAQLGRTLVAVPEAVFAQGPTAPGPTAEERSRTVKKGPTVAAADLADRTGYDPDFLGKDELLAPMPELPDDLLGQIAPVKGRPDGELKYTHFSLKMRAARRVALFTAVNIDGNKLFGFPREKDHWFSEPRLEDPNEQTDNELYAKNRLDRGHLVRRLDPAWGDSRAEAQRAVDDTFFFTNCSPQHERLNQQTWLSLEDYVLKNAATNDLKVCVFSGPVFGDNDRSYRGVQIPEEFWKVVTVVNAFTKRLSVTGYLLSQGDLLGDLEFVYGQFRTYQVPVARIEAKTHLSFGDLTSHDPLGSIESRPEREILGMDDIVL